MRRFGLSVLVFATLSGGPLVGGAHAAKKKPAARPAASAETTAPSASTQEVNNLKGEFRWGMTPAEVLAEVAQRIEASYADRLKETVNDPTRQNSLRKQMRGEIDRAKKENHIKFEGQKSGYDVSIIDQEFAHRTNEAMFVAKEDNTTRYFFFVRDRLYKMFIVFDKDMLQGKSFQDFGGMMQARFGKAREVVVEKKSKAGVQKKLDHYLWTTKSGDVLRLVDRSEFYDVYCLVLFDAGEAARLAEARKAYATGGEKRDPLIEAITSGSQSALDPNDNVVDRITGRKIYKPGEEPVKDIVVPSPSQVKAPTPAEVNRKGHPAVETTEKRKPASKGKGGRSEDTAGLEL